MIKELVQEILKPTLLALNNIVNLFLVKHL